MDKQRILAALDVLAAELADAEQLPPEAASRLRELEAEIRARLQGDSSSDGDRGQTLPGLQAALLEFESEHPRLTGAIGQVASALANLGI